MSRITVLVLHMLILTLEIITNIIIIIIIIVLIINNNEHIIILIGIHNSNTEDSCRFLSYFLSKNIDELFSVLQLRIYTSFLLSHLYQKNQCVEWHCCFKKHLSMQVTSLIYIYMYVCMYKITSQMHVFKEQKLICTAGFRRLLLSLSSL